MGKLAELQAEVECLIEGYRAKVKAGLLLDIKLDDIRIIVRPKHNVLKGD